ncbi:MAG TPA: DinB family protein [Mycobacteriales bacterium]|nr:DinB family protein [Mycobacteriales bacterium]
MNRTEIEITLNRGRADALEMIAAMGDDELRAPRTRSEHDPDSWWSWADHFIHISLIEKNFNAMIRRHIAGEQGMDRAMVDESGKALRPMGDIMAYVHELTESWKVKHEGMPLQELVRISSAIRAETLKLLSEIDDEQLQSKIPGAPWSDGTVGGIIAVHSEHWGRHQQWAREGAPVEAATPR